MKNSIEEIWKAGFLNEKSLIAPKINNLYNQKSKGLIDKITRMYKINLIAVIILAIIFPIIYYFIGVIWQGIVASVLLLLTAWYSKQQQKGIKTIDQGTSSLDYLKSFDLWLKDTLNRGGKILRFTYPIYFLIAWSTIGSVLSRSKEPLSYIHRTFPDLTFIGSYPLIGLIVMGLTTLLMIYFSDRIYKWDVALVYGRVFRKLEETIAEMEKLKLDK